MSTIRVDNFGPSAGGTTYSADGIGKQWIYFSATIPDIYDSLNTSSLTDEDVGRFTVNLTNSYSSANFVCTTCQGTGGTSHINSPTSGSDYQYRTYDRTNPSNYDDLGSNHVISMGDLA